MAGVVPHVPHGVITDLPPDGEMVMSWSVEGGGHHVRVATDKSAIDMRPSPFPDPSGRYRTYIKVFRYPTKPPYEAGPVPGSLW